VPVSLCLCAWRVGQYACLALVNGASRRFGLLAVGDSAQRPQVQKFGSLAALSIVLTMLFITVVLVVGILLKVRFCWLVCRAGVNTTLSSTCSLIAELRTPVGVWCRGAQLPLRVACNLLTLSQSLCQLHLHPMCSKGRVAAPPLAPINVCPCPSCAPPHALARSPGWTDERPPAIIGPSCPKREVAHDQIATPFSIEMHVLMGMSKRIGA